MKSWKYKHIWSWDSLGSLSQPGRKQEEKNLILTNDLQEDLEPAVNRSVLFWYLATFNSFRGGFNFLSSSKYSTLFF